jgi:hypothetical protein
LEVSGAVDLEAEGHDLAAQRVAAEQRLMINTTFTKLQFPCFILSKIKKEKKSDNKACYFSPLMFKL